ncbi:unannotated protein [freshwater metagenome]|uniref:Unannotated protein n=1 Tax=freshwater metagenome TaxID=449393 RepID=A0A6J7E2F1_9ZZZZ|nr:ABC transporter substrate-binding protein [Actinomycetota bacterium]
MNSDAILGRRKPFRWIVTAGIVTAAVGLAACGGSDNKSDSGSGSASGGTTTEAKKAAKPTELVFGNLVGLPAEGGTDFANGVAIGIKEINDAGGVEGVMISEKQFKKGVSPETAVQAYRQAAADPSVLVAWAGAGGGQAIKAQADKVKLAVFNANGRRDAYDPVGKYFFAISADGEYATSALVWANQNVAPVKKLAVLHFDSDYSLSLTPALKERCEGNFKATPDSDPLPPLGCKVVDEEQAAYDAPVDALIPQLTKMKNSGADTYYIECLNPNAMKAARQLGLFDKAVISDQNCAVPALAAAAGPALNGLVIGAHKCAAGDEIPATDPVRVFCDNMKKNYAAMFPKLQWANYSIYGNDAVHLFAEAARKLIVAGKEVTRDSIRDELEAFDGTGDFTTSHGKPKTSATNHRITGTWKEAYADIEVNVAGDKPSYKLAKGADPTGADW